MSRLLLWGALAACALGCSASDNTEGGGEGPGTPYSSYLASVATAVTDFEQRCGILDASRVAPRKTLVLSAYPGYLTELKDTSARAGRVTYSASCVSEGLKGGSCAPERVSEVLAACAGQEGQGRLAAGRICRFHDECKQGYCKGVPLREQCGMGTCAAYGKLGAPCPEGARACEPGAFFCRDGACFPVGAEGQGCREHGNCKAPLRCVRATADAPEGKCGTPALGNAGDACDLLEAVGKGCQGGLSCYKDDMGLYKCQPTVPMGQPCRSTEACVKPATCVRAASMDPMGTCTVLGKGGAPCSDVLGSSCQATLRCYAADAMAQALCVPLAELNERCDGDKLPCLSGICPSGAGALCRPKAGAELACTNNNDCASGLCDTQTRLCKTPLCG